jgi:hypothetical protein
MPHDQFVIIPVTAQGAYTDLSIAQSLTNAMASPFSFTDVYIYSHGWWTTAEGAMNDYSKFTIGIAGVVLSSAPAATVSALGVGIHWPATISENSGPLANILEPLTYFNRSMMADDVGQEGVYATLRLIIEGRQAAGLATTRLHLIGHSFGCKVVCAALQALATQSANLLAGLSINVVLLQAAFECNALDTGQPYANVPGIPNIRMLITHSDLDTALRVAFPAAGALNLFHRSQPALGFAGPTDALKTQFGGAQQVSVNVGFTTDPGLSARLVVADLTPLHTNDGFQGDLASGHHTDIFQPEVYRMIAQFVSP